MYPSLDASSRAITQVSGQPPVGLNSSLGGGQRFIGPDYTIGRSTVGGKSFQATQETPGLIGADGGV